MFTNRPPCLKGAGTTCRDWGIIRSVETKLYPSTAVRRSPVSAAASVGAIGLRPMVATGNPHPLGKGGYDSYHFSSTNPDLFFYSPFKGNLI